MRRLFILCIIALSLFPQVSAQETAKIVVDLTEPGLAFPRTLNGIFFEDINYGADGGLYAEVVQNRSFEHDEKLYSWSKLGEKEKIKFSIEDETPLNENNKGHLAVSH